jgi:hypothetical protein
MLKAIPKDYHDTSKGTLKLLWEEEWRAIGITQVRAAPARFSTPSVACCLSLPIERRAQQTFK